MLVSGGREVTEQQQGGVSVVGGGGGQNRVVYYEKQLGNALSPDFLPGGPGHYPAMSPSQCTVAVHNSTDSLVLLEENVSILWPPSECSEDD